MKYLTKERMCFKSVKLFQLQISFTLVVDEKSHRVAVAFCVISERSMMKIDLSSLQVPLSAQELLLAEVKITKYE